MKNNFRYEVLRHFVNLIFAFFIFGAKGSLQAAPGDLDTTFGGGSGLVTTIFQPSIFMPKHNA